MPDVEELIRRLNSLRDGDAVVGQLIAAGDAAIEPLRKFLLEGRPASLYEPRRWAVEALGGLRAKGVLLEYLHRDVSMSDPMIRMGEDVVRDAAIRELASWRTESLYRELLELSRRRLTPGLIEVLGDYGRAEAIPVLDRALEDDVCRPAAERAFRQIGRAAAPALALSAATPLPNDVAETPSSVLRRRSALKLMEELGADAAQWPLLEHALDDSDAAITILACRLGMRIGPRILQRRAGLRALAVLPELPWDLREIAAECLAAALPDIEAELDAAIARCRRQPAARQVVDATLATLLRARHLASSRDSR